MYGFRHCLTCTLDIPTLPGMNMTPSILIHAPTSCNHGDVLYVYMSTCIQAMDGPLAAAVHEFLQYNAPV